MRSHSVIREPFALLAFAALIALPVNPAAPKQLAPAVLLAEAPADGAGGVSSAPTLCVQVSDPGGRALNVTFHGREGAGAQQDLGTQTVLWGGQACVSWPARPSGTSHEWYVTISDGTATMTGPIWDFTTDSTCTVAGDCDDDNACTVDACEAGTCSSIYTPTPGCCTSSPQCDDANACTVDTCEGANLAALSFDGTNDYVAMGQAPGLGASQFTIETWMYWTGGGTTVSTGTGGIGAVIPILSKGGAEQDSPPNLNMNYLLGIAGGRLAGDFEDAASGLNHPVCTQASEPTITVDTWHHVAATYDGATWALYLDGSALPIDTACSSCSGGACTVSPGATPEAGSIQHFALGTSLNSSGAPVTSGGGPGFFQGRLDEARVWDRALTAAEIAANMSLPIPTATNLVGRWALDEGTGTTTADSTTPMTTAEDGTLTGGPTWVTAGAAPIGSGTCSNAPIGGCTPCTTAADCDDGNLCTTDACNAGVCANPAVSCDDGNVCNGVEVCNAGSGACDPGPPATSGTPCSDGNACTTADACDGAGSCVGGSTTSCDDGSACTTDTCSAEANGAVSFSGAAGNRVQFPTNAGVDYLTNFGSGSFTIEGWVYTDGGAASLTGIFRQGRQGDAAQAVVQLTGTSNLQLAASVETTFAGADQVDVTAPGTLSVNTWTHFAMVVDRTTGSQQLRLHVNGGAPTTAAGSANWGTNPINSSDASMLGVARDSGGALINPFDGRLDEIRIWNYARTTSQIAADMNRQITAAPGLMHRWGFSEGALTTAADSVGSATGTLTSGPTWTTGPAAFTTVACSSVSLPNGTSCANGTVCDGAETCQAGVCQAGTPLTCNDGNICTTDSCHPTSGCQTAAIPGCCTTDAHCADGNSCTVDYCPASTNAAAITFDGTDDYVTMGAATGTSELGATAFTLEAWINWTGGGLSLGTGTGGLASAIPILSKGGPQAETPANVNMNYFLGIGGGRLVADFEDATTGLNHPVCTQVSQPMITTNTWHHTAATYDGTWKLYLDGVELPIDTACSSCSGAACTVSPGAVPESGSIQHFAVGTSLTSTGALAQSPGPGHFQGRIDEVRVWNVARTKGQIQADRNREVGSDTNLIGRWDFDQAAGTSATDSSGRGNNGTLTNGPTWSTTSLVDLGALNVCEHEPASGGGCCLTNADCSDGDPCTSDVCNAGTCTITPVPGCTVCSTDAQCDDSNSCTTDACNTANDAAVDLRGASDSVNLGRDATTPNYINNFGSGSFTVEGWFYADVSPSVDLISIFRAGRQGAFPQVVVQLRNNSGIYVSGSIEGQGGGAQVDTPNTAATVSIGNWHHVAMVVDRGASQVRVYLNGNLGGSVALPAALTTLNMNAADDTVLGATRDSAGALLAANNFGGRVDEVRIWNYARTQLEIQTDRNREIVAASGLVHRWGFNEASGNAIDDPGTFDGVMTSGATRITTGLPLFGNDLCTHGNVASGASCTDGDVCTTGETCNGAGTCGGGTSDSCDDSNVCTTDSCHPISGCQHAPITGGGTTTCGVGACQVTTDNCLNGVPQTCTPGTPAGNDATCNGVDDDCDGSTDEDYVGVACDGPDTDLCTEGLTVCSAGSVSCTDTTGNNLDVCNGVDDDCDPASADGAEDPGVGVPCDGADSDLCVEGVSTCTDGSISCSDTTSDNLDLCNGADDDCDPSSDDGSEDPGVGVACDGADSDLCEDGITVCSSGSISCADTTGDNLDLCNGADDDCDPSSDDGSEDPGVGVACDGADSDLCEDGVTVCSSGSISCSDTTSDNLDLCNGVDDDCDPSSSDGSEDPGVGVACDGADSDLCEDGVTVCSSGSISCADTIGDNLDLCNGADDDCDPSSDDGSEDPGVGVACDGADSDLCEDGITVCSSGSISCSDTTSDNLDLCNGADDDCDPSSDDGSEDPGVGIACDGPDGDLCMEGTSACVEAAVVCSDASGTSVESCNGVDDDCDGATDENGTVLCDDGNTCNGAETCGGASGCQAGTPPTVDSAISVPDDVTAQAGGTILVPILAQPAVGSGVELTLTYDASVLQPVSVEKSVITENATLTFDLDTPGEVRISLVATEPLSGAGPLVFVSFNVLGAAGSVSALGLTLGDVDAGAVSTCLNGGSLAVCGDANAVASGVLVDGKAVTTITWTATAGATRYDVASGALDALATDHSTTAASCLVNDSVVTSGSDSRPTPSSGSGYYYIVRPQGVCANGSYGIGSNGNPRWPAAACP
jgi:concanavalin A-like lectin/glucanase superfamily protein/cohesin domain-containing protein/slime mold repeat-containing protein